MHMFSFIVRNSVVALAALSTLACHTGLAAGPLGSVEVGRGQPIEIRALLSGSVVPSVSPLIQIAIELAIKDFGPIHGHRVSVETLDEKCSGAGGRAAAEAVVAEAQVVGVIGTLCSGAAVTAAPILGAVGLSMVSSANTSSVLTSDLAGNAGPDRHKGYYRVTDNDLIEASVVTHFSYDELGLRKMVTVHDGDAYTRAIAKRLCSFVQRARRRGSRRRAGGEGPDRHGRRSRPVRRRGPGWCVHPAVPGGGGNPDPAGSPARRPGRCGRRSAAAP